MYLKLLRNNKNKLIKSIWAKMTTNFCNVHFRYTICKQDDARKMHMYAISEFLGKPDGIPDERMLIDPIWSTWAQFKTNINQSAVLKVNMVKFC